MTAEWLLSIAKVLDHEANLAEVYDRRGMGGSMGTVSVFSDAAALCRAVAGAEEWYRNGRGGSAIVYLGFSPGFTIGNLRHVETTEAIPSHPTLAAALASIHPEAGGTV